ncbi:34_t:CDS:2 [Entrophospora sp. SA101]|nr:34_t:CDS:2 [Entrophospora sp. SA101]
MSSSEFTSLNEFFDSNSLPILIEDNDRIDSNSFPILVEDNDQIDSILEFDEFSFQESMNDAINIELVDDNIEENLSMKEFDKVTPCVIIDNDKNGNKIERCNCIDRNRSISNLSGSFEIDSGAVKEVGEDIQRLGMCLRHLNYDQNTLHKPLPGETQEVITAQCIYGMFVDAIFRFHVEAYIIVQQWKDYLILQSFQTNIPQRVRYICTNCWVLNGGHLHIRTGTKHPKPCIHDKESSLSLILFSKWINNVASSDDINAKNKLLNLLIQVFKDFNTEVSTKPIVQDFTSTESIVEESSIPSNNLIVPRPTLFLLSVAFRVNKMPTNENLQSNKSQTESYIKFSKSLATSVWKSHTKLIENKETLENPATLAEFYEIMPKDLTDLIF